MAERPHAGRWRRCVQQGTVAVEAAFVLPVVIVVMMMVLEIVNIGLSINLGAAALERAVQQFRLDGTMLPTAEGMKGLVRERMASHSHGYLGTDEIVEVDVASYASLDALGGGHPDADSPAEGTEPPAVRITVDIQKSYITPLPRLLNIDSSSFRYRFQELLAYMPPPERVP